MPTQSERCKCDGAAYRRQDHPFLIHPTCPVHGEVEAILASGRYVDRSGSMWTKSFMGNMFTCDGRMVTPDQMRLRIIRDQHRDE